MRMGMQKMRDCHAAERLRTSEQHLERLCRSVGLSEKHTDELVQGKVLVVTGKLHSDEYRHSFTVEKARLQVGGMEKEGKTVLGLLMDKVPITAWFKEKWEKIRQTSILSFKENGSKGIRL